MAEIGFEKRDFRMVNCTVVIIFSITCSRDVKQHNYKHAVVVSRLFFAWIVLWNLPQPATGSRY